MVNVSGKQSLLQLLARNYDLLVIFVSLVTIVSLCSSEKYLILPCLVCMFSFIFSIVSEKDTCAMLINTAQMAVAVVVVCLWCMCFFLWVWWGNKAPSVSLG